MLLEGSNPSRSAIGDLKGLQKLQKNVYNPRVYGFGVIRRRPRLSICGRPEQRKR